MLKNLKRWILIEMDNDKINKEIEYKSQIEIEKYLLGFRLRQNLSVAFLGLTIAGASWIYSGLDSVRYLINVANEPKVQSAVGDERYELLEKEYKDKIEKRLKRNQAISYGAMGLAGASVIYFPVSCVVSKRNSRKKIKNLEKQLAEISSK